MRDYGKKFQALRDEKYSRVGEESEMYHKKIAQKNSIINELESDNMVRHMPKAFSRSKVLF